MRDPVLSVILPVYNGAATLSSALRSVLTQTFEDFEIIMLNDASTDDSLKIANSFQDSRLHIVNGEPNRGLAYRLNQGIELARGHYIARMDQDDICFPDRFACQLEFLENNPDIDLLGSRAVAFRSPSDIIGLMPFRETHEEICARPWQGFYLYHPTWMGRVEWFRRYRYRIPERFLSEDQELLMRSYPESRFACCKEVLLAYRKDGLNVKKTLRARRSLLGSQLMHFIPRHQYWNVILSVSAALIKSAVDCVAAIPGCKYVFFHRMSEPVSASISEKFKKLI